MAGEREAQSLQNILNLKKKAKAERGAGYTPTRPGVAEGNFPAGTPFHNIMLEADRILREEDTQKRIPQNMIDRDESFIFSNGINSNVFPDLYNLITSEKNKYSQLPKANYAGKQAASKSPLTGLAEELTQRYANKGTPNQNKVNTILARNPRGLSPENLAEIRDFLNNQQRNYIENNSLSVLRERLRDPLSNQTVDKFRKKGQKDASYTQNVFNEKLREFGNQLGLYEDASNLEKIKLLMNNSKDKSKLRNRRIETLNNFGNQ